jgi:hypothetical protein
LHRFIYIMFMARFFKASRGLLGVVGGIALGLLLAVAGCKKDASIPPVPVGQEYYPVEVGTYRTYAVSDTTWDLNVPLVSRYQFREAITEVFTDAARQKSYRVVRARRVPPATAWQSDSIFVLTPTAQTVTLIRDNRRTVELIFPVREGRLWNLNAYNNNTNDTITEPTRRYYSVGKALTLDARDGSMPRSYEQTLTTLDEGLAAQDNVYYLTQYQQIFAVGVGPVLRRRRVYNYCDPRNPNCNPSPTYIHAGRSRHEVLIDYGHL